ncbi:thioredoxin family protein [Candidatus Woesearchaeota archaeon]|nr:thioredoxin family protein [Candidatus Woesearchaeota archaeon]
MKKVNLTLLIVLLIIVGTIYYLERSRVEPGVVEIARTSQTILKEGKYPQAPEIIGIAGYINTEEGLKIADLRGKVVLVDFWTYTCINCLRTLPYLTAWDKKYRDKGLVIIGVHTPEFEFEKKYENVKAAVKKYGIEYPVVQDNDYATWRAYMNRFWPHKYLIDSEGYIRYDHIGEGAYEETERKIQELLSEINASVEDMETTKLEDKTPQLPITPELYAGYEFALKRGQDIGNEEGMQPDKKTRYTLPSKIEGGTIYLEGEWQSNPDDLELKWANGGSVVLEFTANSVNIVAASPAQPLKVEVFIDGKYINKEQAGTDVQFEKEKSFTTINEPRLYNLVDGKFGTYTLKITANSPGLSFNAFTFG